MEIEFWNREMSNKMDWDEEFRVAMVKKWIERNCVGIKTCWGCNRLFKTISGLRQHVRSHDDCFLIVEKMIMDNPTGSGLG